DSNVVPVGVELTPDGQYALISVENRSDLYALDLVNHSIRIVELTGDPSDMAVVDSTDTTVFVFGNGSAVDVLEHTLFDIETYTLDEPMTDISKGEDFAILYNTNGYHDCYFLDLVEGDLVEYRLQNPAVSVHLAPTEDFAIALTRPESGYGGDAIDAMPGMEIIDLINEKNSTFVLEGQGVGVAYSSDETSLHALLLQEGAEYVYKYNLYTGEQQIIDLSAPPVSIGSMPDGNFYITHDNGSGLVSFLNPDSGELTEVAGFGTLGILDPIQLFEEEE
ncbi:MAG: hypothetical protein HN348_30420, partial [Proteobacteria bacterium]|nr:hypothetical protein [Pseudomonadota bacterium]